MFSRWPRMGGPVWNPLVQLQDEMNRLFDRWGPNGSREAARAAFPAINIWEEGDAILVEAELPGLDMKDLEIYVTGPDQLTLKGERKAAIPPDSVKHRQERGFGSFIRVVTLPFAVDAAKVEARLENGILNVKLAKHESAKPRKILVKAV